MKLYKCNLRTKSSFMLKTVIWVVNEDIKTEIRAYRK